jgi:glycosyltransferase involved in cell wall biosynthesis
MNIALSCYLGPSGLSRAGQEYFKLLAGMGLDVSTVFLSPPERHCVSKKVAEDMLSAEKRKPADGCLQFHVGLPQHLKRLKSAAAVLGSVVVEGNVLSAEQAAGCRGMDALLVPSRFCWTTCATSGISRNRLHLFPYPLDAERWNPDVAPWVASGNRFRFLFMNTWYERKGYDVLLRAWWEEFSRDDQVELVIKSYRENARTQRVSETIARMASKLGVNPVDKAPIRIVDQALPDEMLPGFMKSFDCYVSPHRSEGFGMNIWYAMALGVPVVCTDYGGSTDFAKDDTAWLVGAGRSRPSAMEVATFRHLDGMTWAEPDVGLLRQQMRLCFKDDAARKQRAARAQKLVATSYAASSLQMDFEDIAKKTCPEVWEKISLARDLCKIIDQPAPRHVAGRPVRLPEV